jgi:hypothetical protein
MTVTNQKEIKSRINSGNSCNRLLQKLLSSCLRSRNLKSRMYKVRGPFEKFVDSSHYSESQVCGGAVTVSFSKYLPWHFLQRSTHFPKKRCRPSITSKCFASELPFHDWKNPEIAWGEIWTVWRILWWGSTDPLFQNRTQSSIQISPHAISGLFQPWKWSSEARVIAPRILNLCTRWRWVVSFTAWKLWKSPRYPLNRRLGRPQNRCGGGGWEKKSLPLPGIEHQSSSP